MMGRTHVFFGTACWAAFCQFTDLRLHGLGLGLAAFASLLPDIDHPSSTFGRLVQPISKPLSKAIGHRGVTHSALAAVLLVYLLRHSSWHSNTFVLPLAVGYLSHLAGDLMTDSGIPLLWPLKTRFSLGLWKAGDKTEDMVEKSLWGGIALLLWLAWG